MSRSTIWTLNVVLRTQVMDLVWLYYLFCLSIMKKIHLLYLYLIEYLILLENLEFREIKFSRVQV